MAFTATRYPEWKTLYDAIVPLIDGGKTDFDYEELSKLAQVDIQSDRGRMQFYRFRREILRNRQLWFENVSKIGYSIVAAKDHVKSSAKRVEGAKRKVRTAKAISENVHWQELTPDQKLVHAAQAMLLHDIGTAFQQAARKQRYLLRNDASALEGTNIEKLLETVSRKEKAAIQTQNDRNHHGPAELAKLLEATDRPRPVKRAK